MIKLASTIIWNTLATKIANIKLGHDGRMVDRTSNSTFTLKLVSRSFCIQKCILRPTLFQLAIACWCKNLWIRKALYLRPWNQSMYVLQNNNGLQRLYTNEREASVCTCCTTRKKQNMQRLFNKFCILLILNHDCEWWNLGCLQFIYHYKYCYNST